MVSLMADGRRGDKKYVGETDGIWWKNEDEDLVINLNIDGRNMKIIMVLKKHKFESYKVSPRLTQNIKKMTTSPP